ncbi:MAG: efflux RND transporter periplasmic adaptor subunit [Candidatus Aminicenantes bacterium]|nr:efflux RND transporter periplasmic adaptor subunit [Candidatus Aminicenantes bacterium]
MTKTHLRIFLAAFAAAAALTSCRPPDPSAELARLEKQRDALTARIELLKAGSNPGGLAVPTAAPAAVQIEMIKPALFIHVINAQGMLESETNILISPLASGAVRKIHVSIGDRVERGRLLAELDASVLQSSIAEVESSLGLARTIFEKRERLWQKKIGSEVEYLQAKAGKESLEKRLATLNEQLALTKITAPIEGTIDDILIKEGEAAAAGFGAIRLVQRSRLKVRAALSENYASRVRRGDSVRVRIPVAGVEYDRRIDAVSQVIDPRNRTFQVEVLLPGDERIKPNMMAVLTITDYRNPEALSVLKNIVQETGQEKFLFVAEPKDGGFVARKRIVRTGAESENRVEILEGLSDGEAVVSFGFQKLADGQPLIVDDSSR